MKLYIYGNGNASWYQGRSPTGRVKMCDDFSEACFFTEKTKDEAEDCLDLGLDLYVLRSLCLNL